MREREDCGEAGEALDETPKTVDLDDVGYGEG